MAIACILTLLYLPILYFYGIWLESMGISARPFTEKITWQWILGWAILTLVLKIAWKLEEN